MTPTPFPHLKRKINKSLLVPFVVIFCCFTSFSCIGDGLAIEDAPVEVIDTGFEQGESWAGVGTLWLDEYRLLFETYQDIPNARKSKLRRVMLYDMRTLKAKTFIPAGGLYCWNPDTQIAAVNIEGNDLHISIDDAGEVKEANQAPYPAKQCRKKHDYDPSRLKVLLKEGHGYIDVGKTGGGYSEANAILFRPGKEPLELPVRGGDVHWGNNYIPFLNKYVLTQWGSGDSSRPLYLNNEPRLLRLMSPEGEITEIPYPQKLADYLGKHVEGATVMRSGLLITGPDKPPGRGGFLLLKGKRIFHVWQKNDGGFVARATRSPDGCKLAFTSFWKKRLVPFFLTETPKTVKIIDVCQEK